MTLLEINRAVIARARDALAGSPFDGLPFLEEDLREPIVRPSMKVELGGSSFGRLNACYAERALTVRLYFFAKDWRCPKLENLAVRELLEQAFSGAFPAGDGVIVAEEARSDTTDGVLVCTLELTAAAYLPKEGGEPMGQLQVGLMNG